MFDDDSLVDLIDREAVFNALSEAFDKIDQSIATKLQNRDKKQHVFLDRENKRLEAKVLDLQLETSSLKKKIQKLSAAISEIDRFPRSPFDAQQAQPSGYGTRASKQDDSALQVPRAEAQGGIPTLDLPLDSRPGDVSGYERLEKHCKLLRAANRLLKKETREAQDKEEKWWHYAEVLEKELGIHGNTEQTSQRFRAAADAMKRSRAERRGREEGKVSEHPAGVLEETLSEHNAAAPSAPPNFSAEAGLVAQQASGGNDTVLGSCEDGISRSGTRMRSPPKSDAPTEEGSDQDEEPILPAQDKTPKAHNTTTIKPEPSSDPPVFLSARPVKKRRAAEVDFDRISTPSRHVVKHEADRDDPATYLGTMAALRKSTQESFDLDDGVTEMPTPKKCRLSKAVEDSHISNRPASPTIELEPETPYSHGSLRKSRLPVTLEKDRTSDNAGEGRESSPFGIQSLSALLDNPADQSAKTTTLFLKPTAQREGESRNRLRSATESDRGSKRKADGEADIYRSPNSVPTYLQTSDHIPITPLTPRATAPYAAEAEAGDLAPAPHPTARKPLADCSPNVQSRSRGAPLRALPIESLLLTDFRINPVMNDHKEFAFDDVVRHKDDRAKMTGCTDPRCPRAKDMHAMVLAEVAHLTKKHGERFYQIPEGITLVEKYLGEDAGRISKMNVSQRRRLWTQARLQQQANIYGRCRHRYDRANTPEQYWDTGFPNTQEQERDREEGRRMERKMVEVRRREALKKGGRWLFKDEYPSEIGKRHRV